MAVWVSHLYYLDVISWRTSGVAERYAQIVRGVGDAEADHKGVPDPDTEEADVHAVRCTFGEHLIGNGAKVKIIAELAGHAAVRIARRIHTACPN